MSDEGSPTWVGGQVPQAGRVHSGFAVAAAAAAADDDDRTAVELDRSRSLAARVGVRAGDHLLYVAEAGTGTESLTGFGVALQHPSEAC